LAIEQEGALRDGAEGFRLWCPPAARIAAAGSAKSLGFSLLDGSPARLELAVAWAREILEGGPRAGLLGASAQRLGVATDRSNRVENGHEQGP
jgi:hypothetical protein